MPNRIIKESIRTSKSVNTLSDFQFRVWLYLITYVDDYGRGSADPELLKGFVFPRRRGVTEAQIEKALADLANIGMITLYEVDGESFFCFPNWGAHQRIQQKKSKFPEPNEVTVSHRESPPESNPNPNTNPNTNTKGNAPARVAPDESMLEWMSGELREAVEGWLEYKKERREAYKPQGLKALIGEIRNNAERFGPEAVAVVIRESMSNGYKGIVFDRLGKKGHITTAAEYKAPHAGGVDMDRLRETLDRI